MLCPFVIWVVKNHTMQRQNTLTHNCMVQRRCYRFRIVKVVLILLLVLLLSDFVLIHVQFLVLVHVQNHVLYFFVVQPKRWSQIEQKQWNFSFWLVNLDIVFFFFEYTVLIAKHKNFLWMQQINEWRIVNFVFFFIVTPNGNIFCPSSATKFEEEEEEKK